MSEPERFTRRDFLSTALGAAAFAAASTWAPRPARAALSETVQRGLEESPLVYISPLRSNGELSHCQSEVWFVAEGEQVLIVTPKERWRAVAVTKGLDRARLWVGDEGVWKRSGGSYKKLPSWIARARIDRDAGGRERALHEFGEKYKADWDKWGPRFRHGLDSGERVLLRYTPV